MRNVLLSDGQVFHLRKLLKKMISDRFMYDSLSLEDKEFINLLLNKDLAVRTI